MGNHPFAGMGINGNAVQGKKWGIRKREVRLYKMKSHDDLVFGFFLVYFRVRFLCLSVLWINLGFLSDYSFVIFVSCLLCVPCFSFRFSVSGFLWFWFDNIVCKLFVNFFLSVSVFWSILFLSLLYFCVKLNYSFCMCFPCVFFIFYLYLLSVC